MPGPQNPALEPVDFDINPPVRIVYVDTLLMAKTVKAKDGTVGAPRYGCNALLPPDHPQAQAIQALILRLARAAFPERKDPNTGLWTHVGLHFPLSSGDKEWSKGFLVLNTGKPERGRPDAQGNQALLQPPRLWTPNGAAYTQYDGPTRAAFAPLVWDGVLALLSVQFKAYTGMGGGVTCYLNDVVSMQTGEKITGLRADPSARFGPPESMSQYMGRVTGEQVTQVPGAAGGAMPW